MKRKKNEVQNSETQKLADEVRSTAYKSTETL